MFIRFVRGIMVGWTRGVEEGEQVDKVHLWS